MRRRGSGLVPLKVGLRPDQVRLLAERFPGKPLAEALSESISRMIDADPRFHEWLAKREQGKE